jgi:hypothetical protein
MAQPFTYSPDTGAYRTVRGVVDTSLVQDALEQIIQTTQDHLAVLGQRRAEGRMPTADWRQAVQDELKQAHLAAAALAHGGWDQLDASTRGFVGSRLRTQYDYLSQFAVQVPGGAAFDGQAMARLAQYGDGAIRGTFYEVQRRDAEDRGADEERNVLGSGQPCTECPELTARGWVPIGTLPAIGARICHGHCHCAIETRQAPVREGAA